MNHPVRNSALAAAVALVACSDNTGTDDAWRSGTYRYSAQDAAGRTVLRGQLQLAFTNDSTISGTWMIAWVPGADTTSEVGPQVGSGTVTGVDRADALLLTLTPSSADNNVDLLGVGKPAVLAGEWVWTAFTGPRARGPFTLSRR